MNGSYRIDQIMKILNISRASAYRLVADGILLGIRTRKGGALRIPVESFQRYMRDREREFRAEHGIPE